MNKLNIFSSQVVRHNKISCVCGHCNNLVALNVYAEYRNEGSNYSIYHTGQCPYCGQPIIYDDVNHSVMPYISNFEAVKHLPVDIEKLYIEIKNAFSIGSYTCCVITARTLMANIAVEQGDSVGKSFVEYVTYLQQNCLPSKTNNDWVDKIRQLANDSTHKLVIANKSDAELTIKFIIAILKNVYEFPNSI